MDAIFNPVPEEEEEIQEKKHQHEVYQTHRSRLNKKQRLLLPLVPLVVSTSEAQQNNRSKKHQHEVYQTHQSIQLFKQKIEAQKNETQKKLRELDLDQILKDR